MAPLSETPSSKSPTSSLGLRFSLLMSGSGQTLLTSSLWPLLPRSPRQAVTISWTSPGPSTFPGFRRVIPASTPVGRRTRQEPPRGTSISSCSVSD